MPPPYGLLENTFSVFPGEIIKVGKNLEFLKKDTGLFLSLMIQVYAIKMLNILLKVKLKSL